MENKSSITSLMSAFGRAYYAENSKYPVFCDTIAQKLITIEEFEQIKSYIAGGIDFFAPEKKDSFKNKDEIVKWIVETQIVPTPAARSRFCEDSLKTAVSTGTTQYVILGAGLDTFAFRETALMNKLTVFEVDHPNTQQDKIHRIKNAKLDIPENLHFAAMDFHTDNLLETLLRVGFDTRKKTFFSWLGVSYYLAQNDVENIFKSIAQFAAEGSSIVFDFADENLFTSKVKRVQNMLAMAQAGGEKMQFSINCIELEKMLQKHNFLIYELLTDNDIQRQYYQYSTVKAFEHISYALAVLKGTQFRNTKQDILLEALRLFAKRGYDAVSVRDIAAKLSITQAALYKHYNNKQHIFDSIVEMMNTQDFTRSKYYNVPEDTFSNMSERYANVQLKSLNKFTIAQFKFWTQDEYASCFRKMMTIEQYKNPEMQKLYQQYFSDGVIGYIEDIFSQMINNGILKQNSAKMLALEYYSTVYMIMNIFDLTGDKNGALQLIKQHIQNFMDNNVMGE